MRKNLFGPTEAIYSDYTCYTGIADFVPADIETVGYAVYASCITSNVSPSILVRDAYAFSR